MHLVLLLAAPFIAALLLAFASDKEGQSSARLSLFLGVLIAAAALPLVFCGGMTSPSVPWFQLPGVMMPSRLQLATDGLSSWLLQITAWLVPASLWASRRALGARMRSFAVWTFMLEGTIFGSFLASDLVLFFLFFEAMLVPSFVLISGFGGRRRRHASLLFVIFTALGSAPFMIAIYFLAKIGLGTDMAGLSSRFAVMSQLGMMPPGLAVALFFAVAVAFAVKTPLLPLHVWQAETYTEASSGTAALLSGAMAKVGVYGFLRFVIPLFPVESHQYSCLFVVLGLAGVIYGGLLAFGQSDFKRLMAFSSLGHLGLIVAGIFTFTPDGLKGSMVLMVAHGLAAGGLFLLLGTAERWARSRHLDDFGALAGRSALFSTLFMVLALAAVGIPGTVGFVGEFLVLKGLWISFGPCMAVVAGIGMILTAAYMLRMIQKLIFGRQAMPLEGESDLSMTDAWAVLPLIAAIVFLGFYPAPVTRAVDMSLYRGLMAPPAGCPFQQGPAVRPMPEPQPLPGTAAAPAPAPAPGGPARPAPKPMPTAQQPAPKSIPGAAAQPAPKSHQESADVTGR